MSLFMSVLSAVRPYRHFPSRLVTWFHLNNSLIPKRNKIIKIKFHKKQIKFEKLITVYVAK